jgi:hypothetical protein
MDRELLENVFVTALEGGSNYWYFIDSKNQKKIRDAVPKSTDPYFSTAILTAILDHGVEVEVCDAENPEEVIGVISAETMEERLADLEKSKDYSWALQNEIDGEGDGNSSDVVIQFLTMGEVWFS